MIHHVFANRSNIGDLLAARGIQALLQPHPVVEHLCDAPFVADTLADLSELGPRDLIVIGGGGLFMDYFEPFWEGFRAIARRVPFCLWGVGYCDLKREPSRPRTELIEEIVAAGRLCVVRDALTWRHLATCRLPPPVACPSLAVVGEPSAGHGVLHVDNYTTAGEDVYAAMDAIGEAFAARTGRPYLRTNNRIPAGDARALAATLDLYRSADIVLSSALHGCVIGLGLGRRVLAVSGDWKIESFMQAAGLGDWVCDIAGVGAVAGRLNRLHAQPPASAFADETRAANRAVAGRVLAIARALEGSR